MKGGFKCWRIEKLFYGVERERGKECVFLEVRTIAVVGREIAVVDGTAVIYASAANGQNRCVTCKRQHSHCS